MTNNSLQAKLLILVLAVTLTSIIVISYISISTLQNALESKALQQMVSIREVQKSALENQFNNHGSLHYLCFSYEFSLRNSAGSRSVGLINQFDILTLRFLSYVRTDR